MKYFGSVIASVLGLAVLVDKLGIHRAHGRIGGRGLASFRYGEAVGA